MTSHQAISKPVMSPEEKAALAQLRKKPLIAVPTVALLWASQLSIAAVWYFVLTGELNIWLGCLINIVAYYTQFTPSHDAIHNAVSNKPWLNKLIFFQLMQTYLPSSSGKLLAVMHMQHHRFTNEELDPDHEIVTNWKHAFFTWFFWDFRYLYFYLKHKEHYPGVPVARVVMEMLIGFSVVGVIAWFFPIEVLVLWFIPTRLMGWLICYVFMYLPHVPHKLKQKDAPFQATSIREGWEWLMTPLMMYQNYHLAHHLYPTIPFYRYKKAWLAAKRFHEAQNPAKVSAFRLHPRNVNFD